MAVFRAHPVEIRKALEAAQAFAQAGIDFVAIPIISEEQKRMLLTAMADALIELEDKAKEPDNA